MQTQKIVVNHYECPKKCPQKMIERGFTLWISKDKQDLF